MALFIDPSNPNSSEYNKTLDDITKYLLLSDQSLFNSLNSFQDSITRQYSIQNLQSVYTSGSVEEV